MSRLFSAGRICFAVGVLSLSLGAAGCLPKKSDPVSPPPPPPPVDPSKLISGDFDDAKAMKLLFGNYNLKEKSSKLRLTAAEIKELDMNGVEDGRASDMFASVYLSKPFSQLIIERRMLLFTLTPPEFECHACQPALGGALFSKVEGGWRLDSVNRHILTNGAYGGLPDPKVIKLGKERMGIALEVGFTSTGETSGGLDLIAEVDGKLKKVFSMDETFGDNSGNCGEDLGPCWSFQSKYSYVPGGNEEWYDVAVATSGTEKNDQGDIVPVKKNRRFVFRNGKYENGK